MDTPQEIEEDVLGLVIFEDFCVLSFTPNHIFIFFPEDNYILTSNMN